ncbi:FAD-dependent oxidoreductase [Xylanimonas allomyrinae]|uniref:FAD-dependent oxidoreductase n=1 Tax=Xylanimonas allomyrinae TaxID=2509459 RepID=UPI001FE95C94|nr:FAD-dependent oxidoreductase [Xylanimonas allomyrinae]
MPPRPAPRRFPALPALPVPPASHAAQAPPRSVVVVGAGLAGAQTVAALRAHGHDGRITLLGAEGVPPYDRPPLSKELLTRREPVWLRDDLGVDVEELADDVRLAEPATRLHASPGGITVRTSAGDDVAADAVVLAMGSAPVLPPGWESAWTLHSAADAARLRAALRPGLRLVVVGAGWIGAELAGVAAGAGAEVTVVEAAGTPLERQLGARVGAHLGRWYSQAGVRLVTGRRVAAVRPDGVLLAAEGAGARGGGPVPSASVPSAAVPSASVPSASVPTDIAPTDIAPTDVESTDFVPADVESADFVPADIVLAAVGARPASGWLAGTLPLDVNGRLRVDVSGRLTGHAAPTESAGRLAPATLARIWAVGDVAVRDHPMYGPVPGGHWSAALHDPEVTVRAMLGVDAAPSDPEELRARLGLTPVPRHAPYVFSRQLGHDLALLGLPTAGDDVLLRGDPAGAARGPRSTWSGRWTVTRRRRPRATPSRPCARSSSSTRRGRSAPSGA